MINSPLEAAWLSTGYHMFTALWFVLGDMLHALEGEPL